MERSLQMKLMFYFITGLVVLITSCYTTNRSSEINNEEMTFSYDRYGIDSVSCVKNITLYRNYYEQWKQSGYKNDAVLSAYTPWYKSLKLCPRSSEVLYIDGVRILKYYIEIENDSSKRSQYIDTLMNLYDKRIKYFPHRPIRPIAGKILASKGISLFKLDSTRYEEVYDILKQSIKIEKKDSKKEVFYFYLKVTQKMYESHELPIEDARIEFDMTLNYLDDQINYYKRLNSKKRVEDLANYKLVLLKMYQNTFSNN